MKLLLAGMMILVVSFQAPGGERYPGQAPVIDLPDPQRIGSMSVEQALQQRRSVRSYAPEPLSLQEISQLLWAAQGLTVPASGFRTTPSAGATFPLEIDLLVAGVDGLDDGVYRYRVRDHALEPRIAGDLRRDLHAAAHRQSVILDAPVVMVIAGVASRTARRYGGRAQRYMHMEAGHAAQNVYLQGTALGIGTVVVGAFLDNRVANVLRLSPDEQPLYLMPLGWMRQTP
jgi:SagB-type dehydrogenase family enzyme